MKVTISRLDTETNTMEILSSMTFVAHEELDHSYNLFLVSQMVKHPDFGFNSFWLEGALSHLIIQHKNSGFSVSSSEGITITVILNDKNPPCKDDYFCS